MKQWKTGDRVRIVTREQTAKDAKEQSYFPHFAGLVGTVTKVYAPDDVCVEIDREALPEANANRHTEIETHLRDRWLDSLSQDARSKLSEQERQFRLNYTLVVASADLEAVKEPRKAAEPRPAPKDLDRTEEEFLQSRKG